MQNDDHSLQLIHIQKPYCLQERLDLFMLLLEHYKLHINKPKFIKHSLIVKIVLTMDLETFMVLLTKHVILILLKLVILKM